MSPKKSNKTVGVIGLGIMGGSFPAICARPDGG